MSRHANEVNIATVATYGAFAVADKIDSFDVGALERSVNDSAGRVSAIWLSFVAFSAYLAAAASNVSHRQIFLEEPIKLPTINIDLPLVASAILLPLLFVIYHVYVLLQVVLLARTADAYNEALDRAVLESPDRIRMRQRLANTLFAQIFAGSPREREGLLGTLLRVMAWVTLAIAPVFVLIVFQIKFLPYHSALVTWTHRGLIAIDLLAVLSLWAAAISPREDVSWWALLCHWKSAAVAAVIMVLCCSFVTFPGEPARTMTRYASFAEPAYDRHPDCWAPQFVAALFSDSLVLKSEDFVDDEKLEKIRKAAEANRQIPSDSERTRSFRGRDLRCGNFSGSDLRRAEFTDADLSGALLKGAHLDGATFSNAKLLQTNLDGAQLRGALFSERIVLDNVIPAADLRGASLNEAQLQGALLGKAKLQGASFDKAQLQGADLQDALMQGVVLQQARLQGATLGSAFLQGANLVSTDFRGAWLVDAWLHNAAIGSARFEGANLGRAWLVGARFNSSNLTLTDFSDARVWRTTGAHCDDAQVVKPNLEMVLTIVHERVPGGRRRHTEPRPLTAEPADLDRFVEMSFSGVPSAKADALTNSLKNRLAARTPDEIGKDSETIWMKCAGNPVDQREFEAKRAALLANLICANADGKYIMEGLHRHMSLWVSGAAGRNFARSILGLDGKPCPGATELDPKIKADLQDMASVPAN